MTQTIGTVEWIIDFLREHHLPTPQLGRLEVAARERIEDAGEVRRRLAEFGGAGWVCFTDRVVELEPGDSLPEGIPLSAELVDGEESLHLRQTESGWLLVRIRAGGEKDQLIFREQRLRIGGGRLRYEVAWAPDGAGSWAPRCFRFLGIERE
jgi:hypothetical protein